MVVVLLTSLLFVAQAQDPSPPTPPAPAQPKQVAEPAIPIDTPETEGTIDPKALQDTKLREQLKKKHLEIIRKSKKKRRWRRRDRQAQGSQAKKRFKSSLNKSHYSYRGRRLDVDPQ